jgi:hypothetical protein
LFWGIGANDGNIEEIKGSIDVWYSDMAIEAGCEMGDGDWDMDPPTFNEMADFFAGL